MTIEIIVPDAPAPILVETGLTETTQGILAKLGTGTIGAEYQADALSGASVPTPGAPSANYIGQLYRNTVSSAWYRWTGADWQAAWQAQEPDFRRQAFWSAKVENARFLDRAQGLIFDSMTNVRETITRTA